MKIYSISPSKVRRTLVFQVGFGLIGSSVYNLLQDQDSFLSLVSYQTDWRGLDSELRMLKETISRIEDQIISYDFTDCVIIWTAGKCGFGASVQEIQSECVFFYRYFEELIRILEVHLACPPVQVIFTSSAGGLYEGIGYVQDKLTTSPKRPYGFLKQDQENCLQQLASKYDWVSTLSLRLSSVYAIRYSRGRLGLINTLHRNSVQQSTSLIFGNLNTLRDYISAEEIANYIWRKVQGGRMEGCEVIASGKPTSIFEVLSILEELIRKKLMISFQNSRDNVGNITFSRSSIPDDFRCNSLRVNLQSMLLQV